VSGQKRPGTAVSDLVESIRERIISGQLPPGIRLSQQQLAEELDVSRTPLREALQRLATEGFVTAQANRGMVVAPAPLSDVEGTYALRLLVEPATVAALVDTVTDAEIDEMADALAAMEAPAVSTRDFQEAHLRFHYVMVDRYPAHSADLIHRLHMRIYRHQRLYFSRPPAVADFTWLDRIFLDALRARDGELARHILEFHLIDAGVGMLVEVDGDYRFDALLVSLRGLSIDIEGIGEPGWRRPSRLTWTDGPPPGLPQLKTSNLEYRAPAARRQRKGSR
jgi:DNA-binding GntR family transcriptional regulator